MNCTEHDTAGADLHSCYPDGSAVTLWPPMTRTERGRTVQRATMTLYKDGRPVISSTGYPPEIEAAYHEARRRLEAEQR